MFFPHPCWSPEEGDPGAPGEGKLFKAWAAEGGTLEYLRDPQEICKLLKESRKKDITQSLSGSSRGEEGLVGW